MREAVENHLKQGDMHAAHAAVERWLAQAGERLLPLQYQGLVRLWLGEAVLAEESFREALALSPTLARNQANLGISLLAQGKYAEGLPLYEARYGGIAAHDSVSFAGFDPVRQWRGEALNGRRILLVREQGLGDQIQFIRFAMQLRARGAARVLVTVAATLKPLMEHIPELDVVTDGELAAEDYDCWAPLLSLPLLLDVRAPELPPRLPYLVVSETRSLQWRRTLGEWTGTKPRVGFVWAGSAGNSVDVRRSIPTPEIIKLLSARGGMAALSLQLGAPGMEMLDVQCQAGMIPLLDMLRDMADTAAIIQHLDLVISVDTSVAHLAGALGKPVWLLLPRGADWRWGLQGEQTPWYPTMRLFRQSQAGDWQEVLVRVADALAQFAKEAAC